LGETSLKGPTIIFRIKKILLLSGRMRRLDVCIYVLYFVIRALKQQQVEKSFLPLLTLDCHYSLGSLFMFFVILLFFSPPVFFFFLSSAPRDERGGTT